MPKQRPYYPLFIDVEGRRVVIVGAGNVAARKAETLAKYGARVVVIAPDATDEIRGMSIEGKLDWRRKKFEDSDLSGAVIVLATTNSPAVNALVADASRRRGIPVNVADATDLCDFIVPAVVESGSIQIAVSTGGRSPALARRLRKDLENLVGPEYARVNEILGALREPAIAATSLPTDADRKRFFHDVIESGVLGLLREGRDEEAHAAVRTVCERAGVPVPDLLRGEGR